VKRFLVICAVAALAGCGTTNSVAPFQPTAVPTAPARLYAAGDAVPSNSIAYFTGPFSASTTPTGSIATGSGGEVIGLAIDANGNLIASDQFLNTITGYTRPTPSTSVLFTISPGFTPGGIAFDANHNFYVSNYTANTVDTMSTPLSAASVATPLITTGINGPAGLCFDTAQNLYVMNYSLGTINAYAPPYTGAATVVSTGVNNTDSCAYDNRTNQLIVNHVGVFTGSALVYNLPLTAASVPAATIAFATTSSTAVGTDFSGNLYVGTGTPTINVYAPPFTSASTPTFSFALANAINAIVVGQ